MKSSNTAAADAIRALMRHPSAEIIALECTPSTNTLLRELAEGGAPEWTLVTSRRQSAGRGRVGKSFLSPEGGLYMSLLLRPRDMSTVKYVTPCAAVAVCRAIERVLGMKTDIKWVNDVFLNGKKVCGILTEAPYDTELGSVRYAVLGIGINLFEPEGGFGELSRAAGSLLPRRECSEELRLRLCAEVADCFFELYPDAASPAVREEYGRRLFILGREIRVLKQGCEKPARAVKLERDYALTVEYPDGSRESLTSGEISIVPVV